MVLNMTKALTENEKIILTKYDLFFESRLSKLEVIADELKTNTDEIKRDLKEDVKEIKHDLRWMLGTWITLNTIMLGLMAKGFNWL